MKNLLILLSVFCCCTFLHAQDSINQKDTKNCKQGYWVFYGKDRPDSGIPAEGKVEEGNYINDRKEGLWIKYHDDGVTPKLIGHYFNNRPASTYRKYHLNGVLKESGTFDCNQYQDSLKRYYDTGILEYECWYNSYGKQEGRVNYFYTNGQLEYTFIAVDGEETQKERYDFLGNSLDPHRVRGEYPQTYEITYADSNAVKMSPVAAGGNPSLQTPPQPTCILPASFNPNGYNKIYNENKDIWQDGTFKDGKLLDGKVYIYDKDGILLKVKVYKSGAYHSDGR